MSRSKVLYMNLADIAEGLSLIGEADGESPVLAGKLVGSMNAAIAGIAESGLVGAAEDRGLALPADITLYLHPKDERREERGREI